MVPLNCFVDHVLNLALFIHILLRIRLAKEIIEMEFPQCIIFFPDIYFMFVLVNLNQCVLETLFFLGC